MSEFSENNLVSDTSSLLTNHYSSQPQPLLFTDKKRPKKKKKKTKENKGHEKLKDLPESKWLITLRLLVRSLTVLPQNTYYVQVLCYTINVFP